MNGESNGLVADQSSMSFEDETETETQTVCNEGSLTSGTSHQYENQVNNDTIIEENNKTEIQMGNEACEPEGENDILANNADTENNGIMEVESNILIKNINTENNGYMEAEKIIRAKNIDAENNESMETEINTGAKNIDTENNDSMESEINIGVKKNYTENNDSMEAEINICAKNIDTENNNSMEAETSIGAENIDTENNDSMEAEINVSAKNIDSENSDIMEAEINILAKNNDTENNGITETEIDMCTKNIETSNNANIAESLNLPNQNIIDGEVEGNLKDKLSDGSHKINESQKLVANNNNNKNLDPDVDSSNKKDDVIMEMDHDHDSIQPEKGFNGVASNQDSDNESCHYVDDPEEDPIATSENNDKREPNEIEKQDDKVNKDRKKPGNFEIVAIENYETSEENSLDSIEEHEAHDTVSLTSGEDESSNDSNKCNDVIIIDNYTPNKKNAHPKSPEIHEIGSDISDNDDCVVTAVEKLPKAPKRKRNAEKPSRTELRRSSRAVKRTERYSDVQILDKSDDEIQEVQVGGDGPQDWKAKNMKIIASKVAKNLSLANSKTAQNNSSSTKSSKTLCQTIAARGISITPTNSKRVEAKSTSTQVTPVAAPEPILPTLADDMFVVEAPSFIVPYVYEKPASIAFKPFVEELGKKLEEDRAKVAKEALERKIAEKAKRQQERQEKKDRGEEVEESEEELTPEELEKKKAEKAERRERRRRKKDEDDASWDGASEESEDDDISDDDSQTKEPSIVEEVLPPPVTDSFFNHSLAKFFMDIGSNLIQEYVQTDLLKEENRKLRRENRGGHDNRRRKASIAQLTKNLELSQKTNKSFKFDLKKCKFCSFKTESAIAMAHHMETPHMINNMFICNFCSIEPQNTHNILVHMELKHGVKARLERPLAPHQCVNCPFEDTVKGKLGRHLIGCAKKFKPDTNLAPPIDWEHPAKIPKLTKARPAVVYNPVTSIGRAGTSNIVGLPIVPGPRIAPKPPTITPVRLPIVNSTMRTTHINVPKPVPSSVPPVPRPVKPVEPISIANAKGVVICEICDGYIKDLEQLRNHMQWTHSIKIHPKMIYNRPPLNCQKCQFKFFTDQGLERHLLGSHGLVTSAIQEAANKGKDSGRCPVCGRSYQRKLLAHVSRDHNMVLKPAHLSYKCTVCAATFSMYRQFENHVYSAHSVVAKKAADKKAAQALKPGNDAAKQAAKPAN